MRTAITLLLVGDKWVCAAGPDGHGAKNGVPAPDQRQAVSNAVSDVSWPKDATKILYITNDEGARWIIADRESAKANVLRAANASKHAEEKLARAEANVKAAAEAAKKEDEARKKVIADQEKEILRDKEERKRAARLAANVKIETPK